MAFAARRVRAHAGLLSALAAVALLGVAGIGALDAAAARGLDSGVARIVELADPSGRAVRLDAPLAEDGAAQDAEATALIDEAFGALPVSVVRSIGGGADAVIGAAPVRVLLLADPTAASRATLIDGAWPADDAEVAVAEPAAERLGLTAGDTLTIGGADVVVSGLWAARDAADPAWLATPAVASGAAGDDLGPVLGSETWVTATSDAPRVGWVIMPTAPVTAATAPGYAGGVARLAAAASSLEESTGVGVSDDLSTTLRRAIAAVGSARAMLLIPVLVAAVIGGIVLGVLVASVTRARGAESRLLRARGASVAALLAASCLQAVLATGVGAVVGAVVALIFGAGAGIVAVAALLVVVGACVLTAALTARELADSGRERSDLDRTRVVGMLAPLVLAAVAAGLGVVQLYASGLTDTASGTVDPIAAAAPALTLVALCLLGTLVASPVVAAAERVARASTGLPTVLALRRLSRQARSVTAGVLSLALAAAVVLFAVSLAGAVSLAQSEGVTAVVGEDLRAVYDIERTVDARHKNVDANALRAEPGIGGAFPALSRPATIGEEPVLLVAAAAGSLAGSPSVTDSDATALVSLPAGTIAPLNGSIAVAVTATASTSLSADIPQVEVAAFTVSADGVGDRIPLGTVPADGDPHELRDAFAASGLLAIEVGTTTLPGERIIAVSLTAEGADGPIEFLAPRAVLDATHRSARVDAVRDLPAAVPAVITEALAAKLAVGVGSDLAVDTGSTVRPIPLEVAGVVATLPGIGRAEGVAVDLPTLLARAVNAGSAVLAANEVWVRTDDRAAASSAIRATATDRVTIVSPTSIGVAPVTAPAIAVTLAGAFGAAAMALAAFVIVSASLGQRRRREELPLRSFGFTGWLARRTATIQLVSASAVGLLVGVAAGAVAAAILVPALVLAAVP